MLKGLIFDVDGTLVDNSALHIEAFRLFLSRFNPKGEFNESWFARRNEDILKGLIPDAVEKYGWEALSDDKEKLYREHFRERIKPVAGIRELVTAAKAAGLRCGVGSSAPRQNVEFHLDICGIREYMDCCLCMEDVKVGKPDPDIYLRCCASLGLTPAECIVFEDASAGIQAGKAAGCKVVALATFNSEEMLRSETGADLVVKDFTECSLEVLEKLSEDVSPDVGGGNPAA